MPANHGVGLHDDEDICPPRPEPAKEDPEEPVRGRQPGPRPPLREDGDLLTEGEVLDGEVGAITEKRAEAVREKEYELSHGARMADLGLLSNVVPVERPLRGRGRPISNHQHCRPGIEFCRTTTVDVYAQDRRIASVSGFDNALIELPLGTVELTLRDRARDIVLRTAVDVEPFDAVTLRCDLQRHMLTVERDLIAEVDAFIEALRRLAS